MCVPQLAVKKQNGMCTAALVYKYDAVTIYCACILGQLAHRNMGEVI